MQVVLYCDNRMGATPVKCTYSQTIGTQFSDSMQVRMIMLIMMLINDDDDYDDNRRA